MLPIMQNLRADKPLTVLLTGSGSIARRHARHLRSLLPEARILAVCRHDDAKRWATGSGIEAVRSVEAGMEARPHIGVVCSVSGAHAADLAALMPRVEALYIEKPVVTSMQALETLASALAGGWDKPTVVGCNLRYLGAIGQLKLAAEQGVAGRLAVASLRVGQWLPDWHPGRDYREGYSAHRCQGGGVIFDLVHELDSASFLFGDIEYGQAAAARRSALAIDADDAAVISLLMASGLPVQVSLDYVSRQPVREYLLVGDEATLRLDLMTRELSAIGPAETRRLPTAAADWDMDGTYRLALEDLLRAHAGGVATRYSLRDALHVTDWMLRLEAAAWRKG